MEVAQLSLPSRLHPSALLTRQGKVLSEHKGGSFAAARGGCRFCGAGRALRGRTRHPVRQLAVRCEAAATREAGVNKQEAKMPSAKQSKKIVAVLFKGHEVAENKEFLGCAENGLGLHDFLKERGCTYIVTDDKEGENSELEKHLPDTNILITTPFHPAYVTRERLEKAKNLELVLTAGVGSDHVDLRAAADKGITVAEVSGSNVVSVAEDEVMRILLLLRNFLPAWQQIGAGDWNVAKAAEKARDVEGKVIGTVGLGRIGKEMCKRLKNFDCTLLYYARHQMDADVEKELSVTWEKDLDAFLAKCDVISINLPLSDKTRGMFGKKQLSKMKKGAYLVNNARGAIVDEQAVVEACESGQLGGYSGDVWAQQPAPRDHPWRTMPNQAMTPHLSGVTLDAQKRYSAGIRDMLESWFEGKPLPEENYIVREGELASQYS